MLLSCYAQGFRATPHREEMLRKLYTKTQKKRASKLNTIFALYKEPTLQHEQRQLPCN